MDTINQKVLIGDDSMIFTGDISANEYAGDGIKTIEDLVEKDNIQKAANRYMCIITAIAVQNTIFPEGINLNELFPAKGSEVLSEGDKIRVLDLSHVADCSSWSMSFNRNEIDVTRLNDKSRKYRLGKSDVQIALASIFTVGESDQIGGAINRNMKLTIQKKDGSVIVSDIANEPLYMLGFVNKAAVPGEADDFVFAKIYLYNVRLGGQSGSAQSYDASGRLTGMDPVFYSLEAQEAA